MTLMLAEYLHDIQISLRHDKIDEPFLRSNLCMLKAMERHLPNVICEAKESGKADLVRLQNIVSAVLEDVSKRLKHNDK